MDLKAPLTLVAHAGYAMREVREQERSARQTGLGPRGGKTGRGRPWTPEQLEYDRHEHPIRWDPAAQLWVCTAGCGYTRPKRAREVVEGPDEAVQYAPMVGRYDPVDNYTRRDDY